MNKFLLFTLLLIGFESQAQDFGLPIKNHPYFQIIEWKGKGGLLMSQNPKEEMNQIGVTLVGEKEEGMWDQKLNPKVRRPFYIFNEGLKYVYFLDNLDLVNNGRAMFNQMNMAGNVKSKTLDVGIKVKRLPEEHDYNKFELVNATVTEKALVYHYRYYKKKGKEYHEFAVFMTHHNLTHIVFKLGHVDADKVEDGTNGQWRYAGHEGSTIHFAWRENKTDIHGWTVKGFDLDGTIIEDHFLYEPENLHLFRNIGYGNTGKYYTKEDSRHTLETGLVSYVGGFFYNVVILDRNGGNNLVLLKQDGEGWEELNSVTLDPLNEEEDDVRLGTFPINEGITYHYKHNGVDKVGILHFEKGKEGEQEDFTELSVYNPSRLILENEDEEFVTKITDKVLVCNLQQFERLSGIGFHHR